MARVEAFQQLDEIAVNEILPLAKQDPIYLAKHGMVMMPYGDPQ
jgi:murein L,D-transpeptidase YcbB/YkuD